MAKSPVPEGYTYNWVKIQQIPAEEYRCGYCGNNVATDRGWHALSTYSNQLAATVSICPLCKKPTFIDEDGKCTPGTVFGNEVHDIPNVSVKNLYDEARKCAGQGCFTASVLSCRKLLMHIAVEKGATAGETFLSYVEYLSTNHYIPPDARSWVDHIRTKGNEANHEITIMVKEDAEELISFLEMLLKVIYEFPAIIKKKASPVTTKTP